MVGTARFELATSRTPSVRATRLRHVPSNQNQYGWKMLFVNGRQLQIPVLDYGAAISTGCAVARALRRPAQADQESRVVGKQPVVVKRADLPKELGLRLVEV